MEMAPDQSILKGVRELSRFIPVHWNYDIGIQAANDKHHRLFLA
jgi:hypothetical protein